MRKFVLHWRTLARASGIVFAGLSAFLASSPQPVFAASCQWKTTAASSTWTDANNWTNCGDGAPTSSDTAQIQTGGTQPIIATAVTLAGLTIDASASLTIGASGSLTLTGNFANNGTYTYSGDGGTTTFNGTTTLSGSGTWVFRAITINSSKTLNAGSTAITLDGTFSINGTFNGDTGSVTFALAAAGSGTVGGNGAANFNNLTINCSGKTLEISSGKTISVAGNFTKTAGTFACGGGTCTLNFSGASASSFSTTDSNHSFNITIASGKAITTTSTFKVGRDLGGSGTITATAGTITFNGGATQIITATTFFNNLTINSGTIVSLTTRPIVTGTVTNNGLLRETQTVNGSSDVNFICLGSTSTNCSAYKGATLNANGSDLGSTTVDVMGNSFCGGVTGTVKRCFDLRPTSASGRNATVTLFFLDSERNSETCSTLNAWRYNGASFVSAGTTGTRQCDSDPRSIQTTGVANFSVFALKTTSPSVPTPITIASIEAESGGADWTFAAMGVVVLFLSGLGLIIRR